MTIIRLIFLNPVTEKLMARYCKYRQLDLTNVIIPPTLCKVFKYVVHVVARQVIATKHFVIHRVVAQ